MNIILLLVLVNIYWNVFASAEIEFTLIPSEIICPFCIALIENLQQTAKDNPSYKKVLCESLSGTDEKNLNSCMQSLNEVTIEKLKNSYAEDICKMQKLCSNQPINVTLTNESGKPNFTTIPQVTKTEMDRAKKRIILKNIEKALTGELENPNGKNMTIHLDVEFQSPVVNEQSSTTSEQTFTQKYSP
ncbi:unnamed protein product [Thelazia callipaeda]|uniref:Saposin B-type domain-containing protein n=1 Tax=Thelazia callipaeda TaxID=103827 RepID=A0A0N5CXD8_THECL|nr:unnamed protein product [Thelazia callipaeda]